jgi:hypothetical protein
MPILRYVGAVGLERLERFELLERFERPVSYPFIAGHSRSSLP